MSDRIASLAAIEAAVWEQLGTAAVDKQHAWRTPVLATVDGGLVDARTVILREVDVQEQCLMLFTDERAAKVTQLRSQPLGTLVMWSPQLGWQLRCRVHLALEAPGLAASSRWARIKLSPAAQDYLSPLPPGSALDALAPPSHAAVARDWFAVITAKVLSIDWLELHELGHRRARFENGHARWLQP